MATDNPADILIANLIRIASAYGRGHDMTLEAIGRKFYGNSRFFPELQAEVGPRSISVRKLFGMIEAMKADWPEKINWPYTPPIIIKPLRR